MSAVLAPCGYHFRSTVTPRSGRAFYTAANPVRSPAEILMQSRKSTMWEFLHFAIHEEGEAPTDAALKNFDAMLDLLPIALPATEPTISTFGSICLDWDQDPDNLLSIIIQAGNKIAYAANFSGERFNGSVDFQAGGLSQKLAKPIAQWIERSNI